jgi:hypothetical protein
VGAGDRGFRAGAHGNVLLHDPVGIIDPTTHWAIIVQACSNAFRAKTKYHGLVLRDGEPALQRPIDPGVKSPGSRARPKRAKELSMSLEDVKKRFVEEVKLRAYDDKYIDKNEEREILQIAIQQGIGVDPARAALQQVCDTQGYVLESRVLSQLKDLVDTFASNDGKIDQKEFNDAVTTCKKACQGRRNDIQCKKMVIEIIEDNQFRTSKGWFSNWYDRVKKEVGM